MGLLILTFLLELIFLGFLDINFPGKSSNHPVSSVLFPPGISPDSNRSIPLYYLKTGASNLIKIVLDS